MKRTTEIKTFRTNDYLVADYVSIVDDYLQLKISLDPSVDKGSDYLKYDVEIVDTRVTGVLNHLGIDTRGVASPRIAFKLKRVAVTDINYNGDKFDYIHYNSLEANTEESAGNNLIDFVVDTLIGASEVNFVNALTYGGLGSLGDGAYKVKSYIVKQGGIVPDTLRHITVFKDHNWVFIQNITDVETLNPETRVSRLLGRGDIFTSESERLRKFILAIAPDYGTTKLYTPTLPCLSPSVHLPKGLPITELVAKLNAFAPGFEFTAVKHGTDDAVRFKDTIVVYS